MSGRAAPAPWSYVECAGPVKGPTEWCRQAAKALRELDPRYTPLGCFNPRRVAGSSRWSVHACGRAVDGHASSAGALATILAACELSPDVQLVLIHGRQWGGRSGPGWRRNTTDTSEYGPTQFHIESRYTSSRA